MKISPDFDGPLRAKQAEGLLFIMYGGQDVTDFRAPAKGRKAHIDHYIKKAGQMTRSERGVNLLIKQ
ncbi:MAG: hypothetical protein JNK21_09090 [Rhodospirillaceae bacterium]|nr:hypothetical protein [Rhodospirillaceae bacterium]